MRALVFWGCCILLSACAREPQHIPTIWNAESTAPNLYELSDPGNCVEGLASGKEYDPGDTCLTICKILENGTLSCTYLLKYKQAEGLHAGSRYVAIYKIIFDVKGNIASCTGSRNLLR